MSALTGENIEKSFSSSIKSSGSVTVSLVSGITEISGTVVSVTTSVSLSAGIISSPITGKSVTVISASPVPSIAETGVTLNISEAAKIAETALLKFALPNLIFLPPIN